MNCVFIKYLPKDKLLFSLWKEARMAQYFYYCPEQLEQITIDNVTSDINFMIMNGRDIDLTTYHGKLLYINITPDVIDVFNYDMYNGRGKAKLIINKLKKDELEKSIVAYYKFF
jgi:hypothetical protein